MVSATAGAALPWLATEPVPVLELPVLLLQLANRAEVERSCRRMKERMMPADWYRCIEGCRECAGADETECDEDTDETEAADKRDMGLRSAADVRAEPTRPAETERASSVALLMMAKATRLVGRCTGGGPQSSPISSPISLPMPSPSSSFARPVSSPIVQSRNDSPSVGEFLRSTLDGDDDDDDDDEEDHDGEETAEAEAKEEDEDEWARAALSPVVFVSSCDIASETGRAEL
jgi:hypothetical protein